VAQRGAACCSVLQCGVVVPLDLHVYVCLDDRICECVCYEHIRDAMNHITHTYECTQIIRDMTTPVCVYDYTHIR